MKKGLPVVKHSFIISLSAGAMILGIGLISWAAFHIWDESQYLPLPVYAENLDLSISSLISPSSTETPVIPTPGIVLYPDYPAEGAVIGSLSIPSIKKTLPIIEGTGTEELEKGVGHFFQSALPGENSNCVLSGHRTTVFAELESVKIGEQVTIQTSAGTFTYQIRSIRIVHKDDKTVIVPADHAVLTLTTCYPFIYVGFAPDRYIVTADLVE